MSIRLLARAFASLSLCVASLSTSAYSGLVVFGDSLSDSGNNAALLRRTYGGFMPSAINSDLDYATIPSLSDTYSNGWVWTQYLAQSLGLALTPSELGGNNYAYGGARVTVNGNDLPDVAGFPYSMRHQLDSYLGSGAAVDPNALYIVAGGGNEVRFALETGADAAAAQALVMQYATGMAGLVQDLRLAGAQHVLVVNVPDFGLTPLSRAFGAQASAQATYLSATMNFYLAGALQGSGATIFDTFAFQNLTVADPQSGFSNLTNACAADVNNCELDSALYWDAIHPTTLAHQKLAAAVLATAVPEPESAALLLLGLAVVGLGARRRASLQQG